MTLGRYIGLKHIQKSASQVKSCGLQPLKVSFLKPTLKDPFCPVKRSTSHISVISHLIKMRFGVSKHRGQPLTCTESHQDMQRIGQDMLLCFLLFRLLLHRRGYINFLDTSVQNSVFLGTNLIFFFIGGQVAPFAANSGTLISWFAGEKLKSPRKLLPYSHSATQTCWPQNPRVYIFWSSIHCHMCT